jgi:hypothetical protein
VCQDPLTNSSTHDYMIAGQKLSTFRLGLFVSRQRKKIDLLLELLDQAQGVVAGDEREMIVRGDFV